MDLRQVPHPFNQKSIMFGKNIPSKGEGLL